MSLNDIQNRHSFSERICDDLCEFILQYLSIKDKFKLEGVSKQFRRTVFQKHYELKIYRSGWERPPRSGNDYPWLIFKNDSFDLDSLESFFKKCPNITSIQLLEIYGIRRNDYNQFFALITKYCNYLLEFKCPVSQMSETAFIEFQEKFGSKIRTLLPNINSLLFLLERSARSLNPINGFPNLEELTLNGLRNEHVEVILGLRTNKLKRLSLTPINVEEQLAIKLMDNFINIQYLCLDFRSVFGFDANVYLKSVSNLKNLIELKIRSDYGLNDTLFVDSIKQIANNCQKLKSIECKLTQENASNFSKLLSPLKAFKQLKRLHLMFWRQWNGTPEEEIVFSFDIFESFPNITHLSVNINDIRFDKSSLKNIDTYLPKLQSLKCNGIFSGIYEGAPQMADILSRMSNLEAIEITSVNPLFCRRFKEEVIKKCRKIRRIDIKDFL